LSQALNAKYGVNVFTTFKVFAIITIVNHPELEFKNIGSSGLIIFS